MLTYDIMLTTKRIRRLGLYSVWQVYNDKILKSILMISPNLQIRCLWYFKEVTNGEANIIVNVNLISRKSRGWDEPISEYELRSNRS